MESVLPAELARCHAPDTYLFGSTELTVFFPGQWRRTNGTFEEQIGRTPLPSVKVASREDANVGTVELACIKNLAAKGTVAFAVGPIDPVESWGPILEHFRCRECFPVNFPRRDGHAARRDPE